MLTLQDRVSRSVPLFPASEQAAACVRTEVWVFRSRWDRQILSMTSIQNTAGHGASSGLTCAILKEEGRKIVLQLPGSLC